MPDTLQKRIAHNTIGQVLIRIIDVAFGIVTLGLITRYLGQDGYGAYTTASAYLQFVMVIVDLGLYLTLLRELSTVQPDEARRISNTVLTLRLITGVGALALAILGITLTPYAAAVKWGVVSLSVAYLSNTLVSTLTAHFQKQLRMIQVSALNLGAKLLTLLLILSVIATDAGLQSTLIVMSISGICALFGMFFLLTRLPEPIHVRLSFDWTIARRILISTWPLAVTIALNLVYFKADTIILSLYRSQVEVGLYGAAYKVLEIIVAFPHMFMGLVFPIMTAAWAQKNQALLDMAIARTTTVFMILTFPLVAGSLVVARPLMSFIAGREFGPSGSYLTVLMLATAIIFAGTLMTYLVLVIDRQRAMIKYFALTAVVGLGAYLIVIPRYGALGAAWVTVATELLIVITAATVVRSSFILRIPWMKIGTISISAIGCGFVSWLCMLVMPLVPTLIVSALAYVALLFMTRSITRSEITTLLA